MNCEVCGRRDPESTVLLPRRQPDGRYNTFACENCARETDMYCQKHQRPHMGFEDETTACMLCIEEILEKDGERIVEMFASAVSQSDKAFQIQQAIQNWLERINSMLPLQTPHALNIARAVVTYSQRMKISPEKVIEKVVKEGAGVILPPEFTEEV